MEPKIIFEDNSMLVVYKPAGMATQTRAVAQMDLEGWLKNYRAKKGEDVYIGIIQRLDQPVEGLMVVAKTKASAEELSAQLVNHALSKHYYAIVDAGILPKSGVMEDYVIKDGAKGCAKIASRGSAGAKKARLSYEVIEEREQKCLVDIALETGRFHQIRVQFSSRKAPLDGDVKYGGKAHGAGIGLCAYRVDFMHPVTKAPVSYEITPQGANFTTFFADEEAGLS